MAVRGIEQVAPAMTVARLHGVADIRLSEEARPRPAVGEELVRVTAVGLCGSDLHWYAEAGIGDARLERPLVVGHEFAGVIEGGTRHGLRVAVDPAIPCGRCASCLSGFGNLCPTVRFAGHGHLDGALRDYLTWPAEHLYPLPAKLSDSDGAMLEPLGVALHAYDLGHARLAGSVAVVGCGPIGLLLCQLARVGGAGQVLAVEPLAHRREAALRYGADVAVGGLDAAADLADGVDVVFEVAGADDAVESALRLVRPGGRMVLVGIPDDDRTSFPASLARRKGVTIVLSRRMNRTYDRAIRLAEQGRVDLAGLVTDRFPLAAVDEAFRAAQARHGLKVVVQPG